MSNQPQRKRAFSPNRGGSGGSGYERTDPDYDENRLARLKQEYAECPAQWKPTYLKSLSRWEQSQLTGRIG